MRARTLSIAFVAAVAAGGFGRPAQAQARLDEVVKQYLAARTPAERDALDAKLAEHDGLTAAAYRKAIERSQVFPDLKKEPRPFVRTVEIPDGRKIEVFVHVPPGYDPKKKAWPLLVSFMGMSTDGRGSVATWSAAHADHIVASPSLPSDTKPDDPDYPRPSYVTAFKVFTAMLKALGAELRIDTNRVFVTGFSHGGTLAWNCATYQPDRVAAGIPAAGASTYDKKNLVNLFGTSIFVLHGVKDDVTPVARSRDPVEWLKKFGYDHVYHEFAGGHELPAARIPDILKWIAGKARKPLPARIWQRTRPEWNATGRFFWIQIVRGKGPLGPDDVVDVSGSIDPKTNRVELKTDKVLVLDLLLNEQLVDPKKEVTVVVNGAELFRGKPAFRARAALDSFLVRNDIETIYPAAIRLEIP